MANILVCDDERSICEMLDIALRPRRDTALRRCNPGRLRKAKSMAIFTI